MFLSIIIPCYNEQEVIRETHRRVAGLIEQWMGEGLIEQCETIYVDDGSSDDTLRILQELAAQDQNVKVLSFSGNFGHQPALLAGMHHAQGDAAVSLDADLQDPPEAIGQMLQRVAEGYEMVYGVRGSRRTDSFFKRATARMFYRLMRWLKVPVVFDHADYRMVTRPVLEALKEYKEVNLFLRGMFPQMGFKSCRVKFDRQERLAGQTKYPLRKMISFAIQGITSFSYFPLRIAFFLGAIVFTISIVMAIWVLVTVAMGKSMHGWASTVLPLYLFGGLQMILIGILGEYIGKIYLEVKHRPPYLIGKKINFD